MSPAKSYRCIIALLSIFQFKIGSGILTLPDQTVSVYGIDIDICSATHQCQPRHRCGLAPKDGDDCGCDAACEYYGDCCYDYSSACNSSEFTPPTADANQLQCVAGDSIISDGYYTIALCRDDSTVNIDTIEKCEHPGLDDILLTIIVSDGDNNIYKNVYCALCNGVPISELTAWEITFNCFDDDVREEFGIETSAPIIPLLPLFLGTTQRPPTTTETPPPNIHEQLGSTLKCNNVEFRPPSGKQDSRRICNSRAKSSCGGIYLNTSVIRACEMKYKGIVYGSNVYKNPHCAICNDDSFYTCDEFTTSRAVFGLTPLTVIVDFSAQSSISVHSFYGAYVTEGVDCATGEVFDPFTNMCLQVTCKPGFILQGSKCVAPVISSGCSNSAINIPDEMFCLCKLQEQSMLIEYQYINDEKNFKSVNEFIKDLEVLEVKYLENSSKHTNMTIITISIKIIKCQLAYDISDLLNIRINKTNDSQLSRVTLKQNCSLTEIHSRLFCEYERFLLSDDFFENFDNTTRSVSNGNSSTLIPDDGYILEIVHQFVNESSICSSLSILTCEVCPQIQLDSSAFAEEGNGTLVHELTGQIFEENEYVFSNYSDTSNVLVCSFLNQTGPTIVKTQFFDYSGALLIISVVGTILSLIGLLITILLRVVIKELKTLSGKIILNVSISLFCALLLTLIQGNFTKWTTFCEIVAVILHYLWLVCFLWMNAMAFELFRTFRFLRASSRSERSQKKSYIIYFIYSWGIPTAYVGVIVGIRFCDCTSLNLMYGDDSVCWIQDEVASFFVFGIPLAVILIPNLILFVATIRGIREASKSTAAVSYNKSKRKQLAEEMVIYIRISTVMGLSWAFGFLASFVDHVVLWYLFTILNSLQGVFIFLAFNITYSMKNILTSSREKQTSSTPKTKDTSLATPTVNRRAVRVDDSRHESQL
ncbi:uncharacterized protein LOC117117527 [Anneissia japonica]|uniref:uncharacterized protein LOC117117527 n=1 Tax=Anneissia japonica TaxID=1529436 RepID=UPI0014256FE0|nr:uncharacterized protein LOC117117527 [Anneissia japonica]XP_033117730.1 uncharacterized protein LOC117117527 [Anneissia japonica]XP_033117731.1 uncharacterized protein LOC117117527 [Anneissia japonica]XP_033117732.1 uncharacterized protein LOC117117527 [Anneissia japonica]